MYDSDKRGKWGGHHRQVIRTFSLPKAERRLMARARVVPSRKGFTMNKVPEAARPSLPFRKSCATLASIVVLLLAGHTRKRPSAYSTFL